MIPKKLLKKLEESKADYEVVPHKKVYTAFDAAATLKVQLGQVVKALLIKAGRDFYLAVLPADKNLDFKKLARVLNVVPDKISIPKEKVVVEKFKVKAGAISAFGSFHKIPVVIEGALAKLREGIFPGGSFTESIKIKIKDYLKSENPVVGNFGVAKKIKPAKGKAKPKPNKKAANLKKKKR